MPAVSIIIPTYNAISYLPEAVQSVFQQSFTDYELIIIDDGSTDGTAQWVSQLSNSCVHLISQSNQGKSAARNAGIKAAQAKYVAFLDADDLWEATKLEQQFAYLDQHPNVGLIYTWTALADTHGQLTGRLLSPIAEGNVWPAIVQSNILTCGSTPLIRADCFDRVGLFAVNLPLAQDWDMWIRLATQFEFGVVQSPLVRYRKHQGNTSKDWRKMQLCNTQVLEKALDNVPDDFQEVIGEIRDNAFSSLYLYLGWLAFHNAEYSEAENLRQKAYQATPQKRFSSNSVRLRVAILLGQFLGELSYQRVLQLIYQARRTLLFLPHSIKKKFL